MKKKPTPTPASTMAHQVLPMKTRQCDILSIINFGNTTNVTLLCKEAHFKQLCDEQHWKYEHISIINYSLVAHDADGNLMAVFCDEFTVAPNTAIIFSR